MLDKMRDFYKGDEITKIDVIRKLRTPIINLFGTYPLYYSFGIIETYFEGKWKDIVVDMLSKEGVIEIKPNTSPKQYRLTPKGVDLAFYFINWKNSEETQILNLRMYRLTRVKVTLTIGLFILGIIPLIFKLPLLEIISFFK